METYQLVTGVVFLTIYWLFIRFLVNHKNTLAKPEAEQKKLKKHLYWGLAIVTLVYFGSQLLINSKASGWIIWMVVSIYIVLWVAGAYLIWQAYRIGIKKDLAKIKELNEQAFNDPQKFLLPTALTELLAGLAIWLFAIAILIFRIKFSAWPPFIVAIGGLRKLAYARFNKKDRS